MFSCRNKWFWPANGVRSTRLLLEIHNTLYLGQTNSVHIKSKNLVFVPMEKKKPILEQVCWGMEKLREGFPYLTWTLKMYININSKPTGLSILINTYNKGTRDFTSNLYLIPKQELLLVYIESKLKHDVTMLLMF